mgnify:CR=1 FL=1
MHAIKEAAGSLQAMYALRLVQLGRALQRRPAAYVLITDEYQGGSREEGIREGIAIGPGPPSRRGGDEAANSAGAVESVTVNKLRAGREAEQIQFAGVELVPCGKALERFVQRVRSLASPPETLITRNTGAPKIRRDQESAVERGAARQPLEHPDRVCRPAVNNDYRRPDEGAGWPKHVNRQNRPLGFNHRPG